MVEDIDDVRAALGIERIDFWGISWGSELGQIYALRHPAKLRSLVLDSVVPLVNVDPFVPDGEQARGLLDAIEAVCRRSAVCRGLAGDPRERFQQLVARIRAAPLRGPTYDPIRGDPLLLEVDEALLIKAVFGFNGLADVNGVAEALVSRDDPLPLLRLAAETLVPATEGNPSDFSLGAFLAAWCTDGDVPWDRSATFEVRKDQLAAALAGHEDVGFSPFSLEGWQRSGVGFVFEPCLAWPEPRDAPVLVPPGASFPTTPALVVNGDVDLRTSAEGARRVAAQLPNARYVEFANAGHGISGQSLCGDAITTGFVRTLSLPDTTCSQVPLPFATTTYPATISAVKSQGRRRAGDRSTPRDRRVAAAAVATIGDALAHPLTQHGLRGGSLDVDRTAIGIAARLDAYRYVRDVAITGTLRFDLLAATFGGTMIVGGRASEPGELSILLHLRTNRVTVTGELGGRPIRLGFPSWAY
jgi:pimeloyl-ACP methyl ester carboxylesterase